MFKTVTLTLFALLLAVEVAFAQEEADQQPVASVDSDAQVFHRGTMGLSFAVPTGGAPTVGLAYFLDPDDALRMEVGFAIQSVNDELVDERHTVTGLSVEVGYRMYRAQVERLRPFLQPGVFLSKAAQEGDVSDLLTVAVTGAIGVEYLFTDRFSLGGSTGLSLVASRGFDDVALTTSTSALFAGFYW